MIRRDFRCPGPSFDKLRMSGSDAALPSQAMRASPLDLRRRSGQIHPLLAEIEAFQRARAAARKPLSDCTIGVRCKGDPNLVARLREGAWPREATVAKVRAWMAASIEETEQGCAA